MAHVTGFAEPATIAGTVPWGWRDIARAIALSIVSFVILFVLLVIAMVVRQLIGTADDLIVLTTSIEVGLYGIILLSVYWTTVRRYHSPWAALGVRPVAWGWLVLAPLLVLGMLVAEGALISAISTFQGTPFVNPQVESMTQGQQLTPLHLVLLLSVAVAAPVVEELFFRGMLYPLLRRSLPAWLAVDWAPFDIISVDNYRSAEVAGQFAAGMRSLVGRGKPVAITEFGCATYKGAADKHTAIPLGLNGTYIRDEHEQATYVGELLEIFDQAGIDSTFVFTFVLYQLPHRQNPRDDLDLASYGIVKAYEDRFGETYSDMRWQPKAAFAAVADFYGR